jgi:hypothetical protein
VCVCVDRIELLTGITGTNLLSPSIANCRSATSSPEAIASYTGSKQNANAPPPTSGTNSAICSHTMIMISSSSSTDSVCKGGEEEGEAGSNNGRWKQGGRPKDE